MTRPRTSRALRFTALAFSMSFVHRLHIITARVEVGDGRFRCVCGGGRGGPHHQQQRPKPQIPRSEKCPDSGQIRGAAASSASGSRTRRRLGDPGGGEAGRPRTSPPRGPAATSAESGANPRWGGEPTAAERGTRASGTRKRRGPPNTPGRAPARPPLQGARLPGRHLPATRRPRLLSHFLPGGRGGRAGLRAPSGAEGPGRAGTRPARHVARPERGVRGAGSRPGGGGEPEAAPPLGLGDLRGLREPFSLGEPGAGGACGTESGRGHGCGRGRGGNAWFVPDRNRGGGRGLRSVPRVTGGISLD